MKILIAEDDPVTLAMLSSLIVKFGHEPVECSDGHQALAALRGEDAPRLGILDWVMPGLNGLEVIQAIRKDHTDRPYLTLLTSRGDMQDKVEGLDAGADDYLVKPIDSAELGARIQAGIRILDMQEEINRQLRELRAAFKQIQTLHGILPICSFCKKIRDDSGYWEQVEVYVKNHSEADFSHSICPDCMHEHYPEVEVD